jgi:hypothetical protein
MRGTRLVYLVVGVPIVLLGRRLPSPRWSAWPHAKYVQALVHLSGGETSTPRPEELGERSDGREVSLGYPDSLADRGAESLHREKCSVVHDGVPGGVIGGEQRSRKRPLRLVIQGRQREPAAQSGRRARRRPLLLLRVPGSPGTLMSEPVQAPWADRPAPRPP